MQHNFIAFRARSKCSGSLFDVFSIWSFSSKDRECKTKVYIFLLLWKHFFCAVHWSSNKKKIKIKKRPGFFTCVVALSIQGQEPIPCLCKEPELKPWIKRNSEASHTHMVPVWTLMTGHMWICCLRLPWWTATLQEKSHSQTGIDR